MKIVFPLSSQIKRFFLMVPMVLASISCGAQESFEFVVLPDTQTYVDEHPDIFLDQMQWIADNQERFSFVLHVGDITQNNSMEEWKIAKNGFQLLDEKVPYTFSLGNHDMGSEVGKFADTRNTSLANAYFSPEEIENVAASFPEGKVDNLCSFFKVGDQNWMVLSLEFGPRNKTLEWADNLLKNHPDHHVIVVTHAYLFSDSTHHDGDDWWLPQGYGIGKAKGPEAPNNGGEIWNKLLRKYKNVEMVFSGHILKTGVGTLVSTGDNGNKVYQMLANYQKGVENSENGGNGFLRIIKVDNDRITVKTYSPWLNEFKRSEEHEFQFTAVKL